MKLQVMLFLLMDMHLYVELRGCTITRVILVNGCRKKQPSRLVISDWKDSENDICLDKKRLKEIPEVIMEVKITFSLTHNSKGYHQSNAGLM